ncbi:hypothetical protein K438DRAFT_2124371 [Mycena galopus ATCC 62051]|nr:hypothetical protein K438DRAFT_2124371 [Mycena galopus ATCC 62051]
MLGTNRSVCCAFCVLPPLPSCQQIRPVSTYLLAIPGSKWTGELPVLLFAHSYRDGALYGLDLALLGRADAYLTGPGLIVLLSMHDPHEGSQYTRSQDRDRRIMARRSIECHAAAPRAFFTRAPMPRPFQSGEKRMLLPSRARVLPLRKILPDRRKSRRPAVAPPLPEGAEHGVFEAGARRAGGGAGRPIECAARRHAVYGESCADILSVPHTTILRHSSFPDVISRGHAAFLGLTFSDSVFGCPPYRRRIYISRGSLVLWNPLLTTRAFPAFPPRSRRKVLLHLPVLCGRCRCHRPRSTITTSPMLRPRPPHPRPGLVVVATRRPYSRPPASRRRIAHVLYNETAYTVCHFRPRLHPFSKAPASKSKTQDRVVEYQHLLPAPRLPLRKGRFRCGCATCSWPRRPLALLSVPGTTDKDPTAVSARTHARCAGGGCDIAPDVGTRVSADGGALI